VARCVAHNKTPSQALIEKRYSFVEKQLSLARANRKLAFANECAATKLLAEMEIFREAVRSEAEETRSLPYRAQQAVALARATQDTLEAEKEAAECEVVVNKLRLADSEEKVEEAEGRLNAAKLRCGVMIHSMLTQNLGRDASQGDDVYRFEPQRQYPNRWPYYGAMEDDSESESYGESDVEFLDPDSPTTDSDSGSDD
jgi:hypothetical protein